MKLIFVEVKPVPKEVDSDASVKFINEATFQKCISGSVLQSSNFKLNTPLTHHWDRLYDFFYIYAIATLITDSFGELTLSLFK